MQIYLQKYRAASTPFNINTNEIQQIKVMIANSFYLTFLIEVFSHSFCHKMIRIQTKLSVCNYLNVEINELSLGYECEGRLMEVVTSADAISRSKTTLELVEYDSAQFEISMVKVNGKNVKFGPVLKSPVLCHDAELNMKYWLSLYEQILPGENKIKRCNLILAPIFAVCSYLPYGLTLRFDEENQRSRQFSLKPTSVCFLCENFYEQVKIKFESAVNKPRIEIVQNWFDVKGELMANDKVLVNKTIPGSNRLEMSDLLKYRLDYDGENGLNETNTLLDIVKPDSNDQTSKDDRKMDNVNVSSGQFRVSLNLKVTESY